MIKLDIVRPGVSVKTFEIIKKDDIPDFYFLGLNCERLVFIVYDKDDIMTFTLEEFFKTNKANVVDIKNYLNEVIQKFYLRYG